MLAIQEGSHFSVARCETVLGVSNLARGGPDRPNSPAVERLSLLDTICLIRVEVGTYVPSQMNPEVMVTVGLPAPNRRDCCRITVV